MAIENSYLSKGYTATNSINVYDGNEIIDTTPPNQIVPTMELPVYGVRPPDRKWWLDQFMGELDNGQFMNSGRLGDGMKRDARIMGALEQRKAALFGSPLELEPAKDTAKAKKICDDIKENWEKMFPRCELEKLFEYALLQGVGIAEKRWDTTQTPWTFTIEARHPQFYLWLWNTGCYHLITLNQALLRIPHKSTQWITHTPYGYKNAFLDARIRALVDPWMMRQWDKNDWAHYNEVYGNLIKKAIVPQQANPEDEKAYVKSVANMGTNTTIKVRQDADGNKYDVELLEAKSTGWKTFPEMMAWCDGEIAQALLGQTASMDSQGGLNSQENPGLGVRSDIAAADDAKLCETLYTQALREYCEYAYGDPDLAPRPKYQTQPPEDELKARQGDFAVSQALVNFATAKAPINVRQYLEELAYPLLTVEEEAKLKADAQAQEQEQSDQEHSKAMQLMAAKKDSPVVDKGQSTDGKSINDTGTSKKEK